MSFVIMNTVYWNRIQCIEIQSTFRMWRGLRTLCCVMIHLKSWIDFNHGVYLHRLWHVIFPFSARVWKTVLYSIVYKSHEAIQKYKVFKAEKLILYQVLTVLYSRILWWYVYQYGLLVSQHQSNLLGLQFNELKSNFNKDKHLSLCQIKIV